MAKAALAVGQENRIYLHAEVAAIVKVKDWSKAYKLVVTRFNSKGKPVMARPCPCCQFVINQTGIIHVEHT